MKRIPRSSTPVLFAAAGLALALSACANGVSGGGGPVSRAPSSSSGSQALTDANDAAGSCADALDGAAGALSNGTDASDGIAAAQDALDQAKADLEQAASEGACTCDTAGLQSEIDAGDTALQPILDGCNAADADALAQSQNAIPGACEAVAHQIDSLSQQLQGLQSTADAVDAANQACSDAFANADAQVAAAQQAFQDGCTADPTTCDACAFSQTVSQLYADAQTACDAALSGAGVDVPPSDVAPPSADPCQPPPADDGQNGSDPGQQPPSDNGQQPPSDDNGGNLPNVDQCTQAYDDAQAAIAAASETLQQTCFSQPDQCAAATDAYNAAVQQALDAADAACGF